MRSAAFYAQLSWLQNVGNRFLNFLPPIFLDPPPKKPKKNFEKKILTLEGSKKFLGEKFKILLPMFCSKFSCALNAADRISIS